MQAPTIRRVPLVPGRNIVLRDVEESDAAFILALRLDPALNRFLSPVADDVERQRAWIRGYLAGAGQAYFVICDREGHPIGTVRLYDATGDSFSWGSWILQRDAPVTAAMESALLVYRLGLSWGFQASHFQVSKGNDTVIRFHELWGAQRTGETADEVHFRLDRAVIEAGLRRFARFAPPEGMA